MSMEPMQVLRLPSIRLGAICGAKPSWPGVHGVALHAGTIYAELLHHEAEGRAAAAFFETAFLVGAFFNCVALMAYSTTAKHGQQPKTL